MPPQLNINPPLLNSACPWATTTEHLRTLLESPSTGGITVRTSLIDGFDHSPDRHRFVFFSPVTGQPGDGTYSLPDHDKDGNGVPEPATADDKTYVATLNNLGYSPFTLGQYLNILGDLSAKLPDHRGKTVIISVTGSDEDVKACYDLIVSHKKLISFDLAMEINLSCPNIPGAPPVAYDANALQEYLGVLPRDPVLAIGIKTPPYTHAGQYEALNLALQSSFAGERLSFITSTNTLGSCLILDEKCESPVLPGEGLGGMAGPPLHPLSLGNVSTIRNLLANDEALEHIQIIGVGGVSDGQGYRRMRSVGASAVALATALGRQGPGIFAKIEKDINSQW